MVLRRGKQLPRLKKSDEPSALGQSIVCPKYGAPRDNAKNELGPEWIRKTRAAVHFVNGAGMESSS